MMEPKSYLLILDCLMSMLLFGVGMVLRTLCHLQGCIGIPRCLSRRTRNGLKLKELDCGMSAVVAAQPVGLAFLRYIPGGQSEA